MIWQQGQQYAEDEFAFEPEGMYQLSQTGPHWTCSGHFFWRLYDKAGKVIAGSGDRTTSKDEARQWAEDHHKEITPKPKMVRLAHEYRVDHDPIPR